MDSALILIGNELLSGKTQDKNLYEWGAECASRGFPIGHVEVIPDDKKSIAQAILRHQNKKTLFLSGGLGPTLDDVTRDAIALAFDVPLEIDEVAKSELESWAKRFNRDLSPIQMRQALMPKGALVLKNPVGSAPGIHIKNVYAGPGVPVEFLEMMKLQFTNSNSKIPFFEIHLFGISESEVAKMIEDDEILSKVEFGYRPRFPEIVLTWKDEEISENVNEKFKKFSFGSDSIFKTILKACTEKKITLSFAESVTGGLLSSSLTELDGASKVLLESQVVYSLEAKQRLAEVSDFVSEETSKRLAKAISVRSNSTIGVGVTGYAGKDEENKIMILSFFSKEIEAFKENPVFIKTFPKNLSRSRIQKWIVWEAYFRILKAIC